MNPQLDLLLKIQNYEIKINSIEHDKRALPIRKTLSKIVADVNSLQEAYARAESVVLKIEQTCEALKKNCEINTKRLAADEKKLEEIGDTATPEEIDSLIADIVSFPQIEEKMAHELVTMKQQLEKASQMALEIGKSINQSKQEYDKIKPEYDRQTADSDAKIAELKAAIAELEPQVDKDLLARYRAAKAKINRSPLYELKTNSCRACNTPISANVKNKVASDIFVECEKCGALLYIPH